MVATNAPTRTLREEEHAQRFIEALRQIPLVGTLEIRRYTDGRIEIFQVRRVRVPVLQRVAPTELC